MCGEIGIIGHDKAKRIATQVAPSVGHRGQSGIGFACRDLNNNGAIMTAKAYGQIGQLVRDPDFAALPESNCYILHTRYPTQGADSKRNIQPHYVSSLQGKIAIASNGDVVNMRQLRDLIIESDYRLYTENDSEIIAMTIMSYAVSNGWEMVDAIQQAMGSVHGSFSAVLINEWEDCMYAFRDRFGIRPLFYARISNASGEGFYIVSSETVSINLAREYMDVLNPDSEAEIEELHEVQPGEILRFTSSGVESFRYSGECYYHLCLMELLYFMRPDSLSPFDLSTAIAMLRVWLGEASYIHHRLRPEVFSCVPQSGRYGSLGYARAGNIPYVEAIIQNPDLPTDSQGLRDFIQAERGRLIKHRFIPDFIQGLWVGGGEDTVVEGFTAARLVRIARAVGARRFDLFPFAPPIRFPCYYGMHFKDPAKLVAGNGATQEEINAKVGCPVHYLPIEVLREVKGIVGECLCDACFTGNYPIPIPDEERVA